MHCSNIVKSFFIMAMIISTLLSASIVSAGPPDEKTLIVCSSYTGNTRVACEAIQKSLGATVLELKDVKNPPENLKIEKDAKPKWVLDTEIEPKSADLASSDCIVLGSPIWMATLAPAMRKFIELNRFDGKKIILLTTTNASLNEEQRQKIKSLVTAKGGKVVGYYEILAQEKVQEKKVEKTKEQIKAEALKISPEISKAFAAGK
jgi:flavodoxin